MRRQSKEDEERKSRERPREEDKDRQKNNRETKRGRQGKGSRVRTGEARLPAKGLIGPRAEATEKVVGASRTKVTKNSQKKRP